MMPVTGLIVHRITGEHGTKIPQQCFYMLPWQPIPFLKKKKRKRKHFHSLEKRKDGRLDIP